jgi:hypothetical protein
MVGLPEILRNNTDQWYYDESKEVANMRAKEGASPEVRAAVDEMNEEDRKAAEQDIEL